MIGSSESCQEQTSRPLSRLPANGIILSRAVSGTPDPGADIRKFCIARPPLRASRRLGVAMFDRRGLLFASATALTTSLVIQSTPTLAQSVTVPSTKRGFVERPGCRIYYEATGSGPAIIFAHGVGSNHMTWWQQVAHFSDRYTCIAFSHRGYPPGSEIGIPDP